MKKFIQESKQHYEASKSREEVSKNQQLRLKEQEQLHQAIVWTKKVKYVRAIFLKNGNKAVRSNDGKNIEIRMHDTLQQSLLW